MTNPRDTGRYDAFTDSYVDQQVQIDFAWGNIPMQPNDDRGMAQLDPALDSHIIATTQYEGFPAFTPGAPFDDTIPNVEVPNLVGLVNPTAALNALQNVGLTLGDTNPQTQGATSHNNLHVAAQSVPAGTLVNLGDAVSITVYNYVSPVNHTIAGIRKQWQGSDLAYNFFFMFLQGRGHNLNNGNQINITGSDVAAYNKNGWYVFESADDDTFNTGGTKVTIFWNGAITETANGTGGTYTKQ